MKQVILWKKRIKSIKRHLYNLAYEPTIFLPFVHPFVKICEEKNLYLRTSDRFIVVGWHQFISLDPGSLGFQRFLGEGIREALLIKHNKQ